MTDPTKNKRRAYGGGGITQRPDGLYVATIEAGWTPLGTRRRIRIAAKTKAECQRKLRDKQRQIATEGLPAHGVSTRTTVKIWSETWLTHEVTRSRPNTVADRTSVVGKWINPVIGNKRIDALTPADIRAVTQAIIRAGRSTSTANNAHRVLIKMLKDAVSDGEHRISANTLAVKAPATAVSTRGEIPTDQAIALLKTAATLPDRTRWDAALLQGMRQGECLGLTWECVDLDTGQLDVSWQLQELTYTDKTRTKLRVPYGYEYRVLEGRLCLTRPKTQKGRRILPLIDYMVDGLAAWQRIAPVSPHGLVWPAVSGRPQVARDDVAAWKSLQQLAGVCKGTNPDGTPIYWVGHESRHTTATLLMRAGVDREIIKSILGHADASTSGIYMHADVSMARSALQGVAQRLQLS